MFAKPVGIPDWTVARRTEEAAIYGEAHGVGSAPLSLHRRRERHAVRTPDIVVEPLLPVVVVSADDRLLRSHRIEVIGRKNAKRGEKRGRLGIVSGSRPELGRSHAARRTLLAHGEPL